MKIASIIGTRPNFIKCAPLSREIRKEFDEVLIHTEQHYDYEMNKIFFDELKIPKPDYHLDVKSGSQGKQTGEMLKKIESVLLKENPDLVIVYGDVNSTLAGALAATKLNMKVAHVEAGIRSFDRTMPEEINRILTDDCSDYLFCPTSSAVRNLRKEGFDSMMIYHSGDVMVDSLDENIKIAEKESNILGELNLEQKKYYLATVHRAENTDNSDRLLSILSAFSEIKNLVFICHPRTEKMIRHYASLDTLTDEVRMVIKPVGYFDMLMLEKNASKIITDSGGVQKEAYLLKVPCITLRYNTEWIETVESGWSVLVGSNKESIIKMANVFEPNGKQRNVFGDGKASERIMNVIREYV